MHWAGVLGAIFDVSAARLVANLAVLATLAAVGFYLIGKFRGGYRQSDLSVSHLLDNFRELHSRGQLSEEEYRNIKSKLADQLREELRKTEEAE